MSLPEGGLSTEVIKDKDTDNEDSPIPQTFHEDGSKSDEKLLTNITIEDQPPEELKKNSSGKGKRKGGDEDSESEKQHKKRLIWTQDLHQKFIAAVNKLGDKGLQNDI